MSASTDDWKLQCSRNGGAYFDVNSSSTYVQSVAPGTLTNQGATTNKLSSPGGGWAFVAGRQCTDGQADDTQVDFAKFTEHLYAIKLIFANLSHGDTLDFRVRYNGSAFAVYSVTPRITVSKPSFVAAAPFLHNQAINRSNLY